MSGNFYYWSQGSSQDSSEDEMKKEMRCCARLAELETELQTLRKLNKDAMKKQIPYGTAVTPEIQIPYGRAVARGRPMKRPGKGERERGLKPYGLVQGQAPSSTERQQLAHRQTRVISRGPSRAAGPGRPRGGARHKSFKKLHRKRKTKRFRRTRTRTRKRC